MSEGDPTNKRRRSKNVTFLKTWKKKQLSREWDEVARAEATSPKITPIQDLETKRDFMVSTEVMVRTAEAAKDLEMRMALTEFVDISLRSEPENVKPIRPNQSEDTIGEGKMFNRQQASFWRRDLVLFDQRNEQS